MKRNKKVKPQKATIQNIRLSTSRSKSEKNSLRNSKSQNF